MTPETFFLGHFTGWGVVIGPFGRVLRRFELTMHGVWSEEHRALHLDETYAYVEGKTFERRWALHSDADGHITGHDAFEAARLRGRPLNGAIELRFDRPPALRRAGGLRRTTQVLRLVEVSPARIVMTGRVVRFGLTIARVQAALMRTP